MKIDIIQAIPGFPVKIGRQGENLARAVRFDISKWRELYGEGSVQLVAERNGDEKPYPVAVTINGNDAVWEINSADTDKPGYGSCELRYYVGDVLAKSETWTTFVSDALVTPTEEPPEPHQGWVDRVVAVGAEAAQSASRAETAAEEAQNAERGSSMAAQNANTSALAAANAAQSAAESSTNAAQSAEAARDHADAARQSAEETAGAAEEVKEAKVEAVEAVQTEGVTQKQQVQQAGEQTIGTMQEIAQRAEAARTGAETARNGAVSAQERSEAILATVTDEATGAIARANEAIATAETAEAKADEAKTIAKGRATGYVFNTKADMDAALASTAFVAQLVLGDNLYIRATDTPDYWWDGTSAQELETQKVDLSEYAKKEELPTKLSELSGDATHRTVTDAEKQTWNGKQDKIADLSVIREGAELGRTAIQGADMTADNLMDEVFGVKQSVINAMVYKPVKRYGIRIKQDEPNPSDRVEYLYDAVGIEPAYMDYASGQFHFGGWSDAWFVKDNFPCMVKFDGVMDYKLNPNDYDLREDGGASDFENVNYAGNAMSAIPLIWVKKYTENGYKYKIFCNIKYDDSYVAYPYTRPNGTIADYLYYPMVKGYKDANGRLRSIGGVKPTSWMNATQEKAAAVACGSRWGLVTWQAWNLIMDLQELMTKSTNRQATLGRGHDSGGSSAGNFLVCGSLKDKGQCYGYNDGSHAVKFLHIENPYGERYERLEGMLFINGVWYVKDTPGEAGYNFTGTGFTSLTDVGHPSGNGWLKEFTGNEHGDFPLLVGGSNATYECDYYSQNTGITSVPLAGAACSSGYEVGRFVYVNHRADDSYWTFGASPILQNPS